MEACCRANADGPLQKQHLEAANCPRASLARGQLFPSASCGAPWQLPRGHLRARYRAVNAQAGLGRAMPCPSLPLRPAHCSHDTINNSGEDEHCPVADGDKTYSLRSELTLCPCLHVCVCVSLCAEQTVQVRDGYL